MAKKKGGSGGGDEATTKREEPLQAVLLADSFINSFRPLSLDQPKVLCPLNNIAMIDYALDFLGGSGVEELFVVCVSDEVENYLEKPMVTSNAMQVTVIKEGTLTNAGDALRELDRRDLVQSDPFILMYGDTVTNVDLTSAIATHKARHKKDPTAIHTVLFKQVGASELTDSGVNQSSIRTRTDDLVVGINSKQGNRILLYDDQPSNGTVEVPCSFFASHSEVDIHYDLVDCGIDLCSPDVLARFQDEFDYRDIRRHWVANSVAEEEEGLQNKIYAHLLDKNEYAARVTDFATYAAISRDLLQRWCYPVVPDNLPSGYKKAYRYSMQRHYMYFEQKNGKTQMGRGALIRGTGMMGAGCSVGDGCRIEQTVVGHGCTIGSGVTVLGAILWNSVQIEDGATIVQSILANGAIVKEGAVLNRGCVVGAGCVIGKGMVIPEFTRVTLENEDDDDFGDDWSEDDEDDDENGPNQPIKNDEAVQNAVEIVGTDGKGHVWRPPAEVEDEEMFGVTTKELVQCQSIGFDPVDLYNARMKAQEEGRDGMSDVDEGQASILSLDDNDDDLFGAPIVSNDVIGRQKGVDVVKELKAICLEYELNTPIENLAIELNSFKFSQNATYADCTMAAIIAIVERLGITKDSKDGKLGAAFKSSLKHWSPLLEKMSIGLEEEKSIILGLETCACGDDEIGQMLSTGMTFRLFLQLMHDEEIVSEGAVFAWAADRKEELEDSPRGKIFNMGPVQEFLEWLEDDEEEEDEDDSEDDDSEED
eukprot:scaffold2780_cov174-Amphora_coffeaeformis.AAC.1